MQTITPVYVAGNFTIHAGYPAGLIPGTQTTRYRKACSAMSRHERHYPSPAAADAPITCKRCLAKLAARRAQGPQGNESEYRGARVTVLAEEGERVCIREANGDTLWVWRSQVEIGS